MSNHSEGKPQIRPLNGKDLVNDFTTNVDGLLYELVDIGERLGFSTKYELTEAIGKWQWREVIASGYFGDYILTEEDRRLLNESFKFQTKGQRPDLDKANLNSLKKWKKAELNHQWLCFCLYGRNKIIRGEVGELEAVEIFSKIYRVIGWIEMESWGEDIAKTARRARAKAGADARNKKKGYAQKRYQIQAIWASGKYSSRDLCAEQECAALDMSLSTARKALRGTPDPIAST